MVNYLLNTFKLSTDQPVYVLLIDYVPNAAGWMFNKAYF